MTTTHLLARDTTGQEFVAVYIAAELEELFTADERRALAAGAAVTRGRTTYVDMRVAARAALPQAA